MKVSPACIWGILLLMPLRSLYGYGCSLTRPVAHRSETVGVTEGVVRLSIEPALPPTDDSIYCNCVQIMTAQFCAVCYVHWHQRRTKLSHLELWSGLTSVFAVLLVIAMLGNTLATANASYINSALGINTARIVETGTAPDDTTYYKSQFGAFDDAEAQAKAIAAALEQNVNEMREGAALLLNKDGALPLSSETRISVFGHGAVDPAYQGSSAGTKVKNGDLNVIDLKTALEAQGFKVNETLWSGLQKGTAARGELKQSFGGMAIAVTGSAAGTEENKAFYEQYVDSFQKYNDAAVVVFTREGAEGTDLIMQDVDDEGGVSGSISSLALHKNERDLLELVRANFDKVIVLLNSPYQMEVHEIKD